MVFVLRYQQTMTAFQQDLVERFISSLQQTVAPVQANTEAVNRQAEAILALASAQGRLTDAVNAKIPAH